MYRLLLTVTHAYGIMGRTFGRASGDPEGIVAALGEVETIHGKSVNAWARRRIRALQLILLGALLFSALGCSSKEASLPGQEARYSPTAVVQVLPSPTRPLDAVSTASASPTLTRQPAATETTSPTPSFTPTVLPSATHTQAPKPTRSPLPSPTPRRLRVLVPLDLAERAKELASFMREHPAYTFLVEVAPSSRDVASALGEERADLGIYEGATPADLIAHAYRSELVAAVVSFYRPLENIALDDLFSLFAGDGEARSRLGIESVGCWELAALRSGAEVSGDVIIVSPEELVSMVGRDASALALVPYDGVTPSVRALAIDGRRIADPDYPLVAKEAVLAADAGLGDLAKEMADVLSRAVAPAPPSVELAMVGDMMLARDMGQALREKGPDYAFSDVRHMLDGADLTMGNLECVIGDRGEPAPKAYVFQAPLTATLSLSEAGFDLLNVANNHILDFGQEAMAQTFDLLSEAGIDWVGAGMSEGEAHAPVIREVRGIRIAFLGYARYLTETSTGFPAGVFVAVGDSPGIAWADVDRMRAEIAQASSVADVVVVALHAGREYWDRPTDFQREAARSAIDAGASLVWGHHAHSWQGIEFYNDGVILYSLGDFVFDQMTTNDSAVVRCWIDARGVRQVALEPVIVVENGRPVPAPEPKGRAILDWIYGLSELLLD